MVLHEIGLDMMVFSKLWIFIFGIIMVAMNQSNKWSGYCCNNFKELCKILSLVCFCMSINILIILHKGNFSSSNSHI